MVDSECAHHWMIETSQGPMSKGVCRLCGENREFNNSPEASWAEQARKARAERASKVG